CFSVFFSSRRRHTRSKRDWSSDVCSSDLRQHLRIFLVSFSPEITDGSKNTVSERNVGTVSVTPMMCLSETARFNACTCRLTVSSDRKSTRLNSSHVSISYAVFCLKQKKRT